MAPLTDTSVEFNRENKTIDVVKRLGVITADRVNLMNHPADSPVTIFNPAMEVVNDNFRLYARIVLGYYTYASAVLEMTIPMDELESITRGRYRGRLVLKPDNVYDIFGVEDPRISLVGGKPVITYCGRTVQYFKPGIERVLPMAAARENRDWKKVSVFKFAGEQIVSDKNAFLTDLDGPKFFHRIHTVDEVYHCIVSSVQNDVLDKGELTEVTIQGGTIPIKPAGFEDRIGWGTPPVKVDGEYLLLLHAIDKTTQWYKAFAVLMDRSARISAVTPCYMMEPRESYEVYGDRPFTVFPCGLCRVDDKLLVSYGAADFATGIGEIDLGELMSMLESNRV